jgi:impB/mucB/samB family C-terminal domain
MRLLFLDWPHLALRLALARDPEPQEAVILGGRPWDPGIVVDHSPTAGGLGVRRGQPLGVAHSLVPEAAFLPFDEAALRGPVETALEVLNGLAPAVEGEADPASPSFGRILVGIEGLARLWGDEASLVRRARDLVAPHIPWPPRTGIGNTRFGAEVAARTRRDAIPIGGQREEAAFLAPLPLGLLPADGPTLERFRILGLTRIGELAVLDRSAVIARFGMGGGDLHDLAQGRDGRPLRPRRPVQRLSAEVELDPPVETLEPLRFVLHHLCGTLCEQLIARGAGAARATLTLSLEGTGKGRGAPEPQRYEQALPEPAASPDLLERLLMARLEVAPPDAAVERLALELDGAAPEAGRQLTLFEPQLARAGRLEWQLRSLAIRFGTDRILRATVGDHDALVAERRFYWAPAVEA